MKRMLVAALCVAFAAAPGTAKAAGSISLDVRDADITDVIALLSAESGVNVIADGSVKSERVTIHLHGVSFSEALQAIATTHGLRVRREGAVFVVGTAEAMNRRSDGVALLIRRAAPEDVAKAMSDALPPGTVIVPDKRSGTVVVQGDADTIAKARKLAAIFDSGSESDPGGSATAAYRLRFLRPDDVVAKLKAIVPAGGFIADEPQNAVLVTGSRDVQEGARGAIAALDRPSPQVMFEVKVADVTPVNDASNFGLEFGGLDLDGQPLPGALTYSFATHTLPVNLRLNALVSKGRAAILATPKLVTINNKEADLSIGETYPIVYSTSVFGGQNVQYVDIGVHLRVTPTIGTDGSVTAELHPEYSELIGFTSSGYPIVANRKIDSTLRVQTDETIVLGGLMRDTSSETVERVPGLSSIPIIGKLFENKRTSRERDEIVFLITPHVIFPGDKPPAQ